MLRSTAGSFTRSSALARRSGSLPFVTSSAIAVSSDNKVVSCHACRTLKADYNPAGPDVAWPLSEPARSRLISAIKDELRRRRPRSELEDFTLMMAEIRPPGTDFIN